ncbi:MAG: PadR family transcriptional regulator [Haloplasmataceae bacterium]|nr:PadR family transcriptional regulator [Haloplasmataceae bacterium]
MVSSEIIRGFIDTIILDVLKDKDDYGYEISKEIETRTKGLFVMKEATLYAAFKRLETKNWVVSYLGDESFGRQRKYYQITKNGLMYLKEKKEEWEESKVIIDIFLGGVRS